MEIDGAITISWQTSQQFFGTFVFFFHQILIPYISRIELFFLVKDESAYRYALLRHHFFQRVRGVGFLS